MKLNKLIDLNYPNDLKNELSNWIIENKWPVNNNEHKVDNN